MLQEILTHPLYPQMGLLPSPRALRTLYPILRVVDLLLLVTQWNRYRVDTILPVREIWPKTPGSTGSHPGFSRVFPHLKNTNKAWKVHHTSWRQPCSGWIVEAKPISKSRKKTKKNNTFAGQRFVLQNVLSLFGSDIKKINKLSRFHPCKMSPTKAPGIILSAGHEATTPSIGSSSGGPPILLPGKSKWAHSPWGGLWLWRCSFWKITSKCCIYMYMYIQNYACCNAVCLWIYIYMYLYTLYRYTHGYRYTHVYIIVMDIYIIT